MGGGARETHEGHREARLGPSPFAPAIPAIGAAVAYAVAAGVWIAFGDRLPGGRWLAVHLTTLGVLTNLIVALSLHFTRTITHTGGDVSRWPMTAALNAGIVGVLLGRTAGVEWLLAAGATGVTAVVFASYVSMHRQRKHAIGARFAWIVRIYERAHGAFIHGAVLGVLLGLGLLPGAWYVTGRLSHLHINLLGWAGLTLLATVVFFGPSIVRTRIEAGADEVAAGALRRGATALTVAVLLLLVSAIGGAAGTVIRLTAALAFAAFGWSTYEVCAPTVRAARKAKPSAPRPLLVAALMWFPPIVFADALTVAMGAWWAMDALGLVFLVGVLIQTVVAVMIYLLPMVRGRSFAERDAVIARTEVGARTRAGLLNLGVVAIAIAALGGTSLGAAGATLAGVGWACVGIVVIELLVAAALPVHGRQEAVVSEVARRHRPDG